MASMSSVPERVLPFYAAFLAGMNLVLVADDAFSFLVSWEFMSLASWALVIAHYRDQENLRAGYVYILMASAGMMALLLAFGILAGTTGGYAFTSMRAGELSPTFAALVAGLALVGAGSKAGLVPLHVWLPLAHPAAPSHVSALMSGVMTKVAVYAFIRIVFDLVGEVAWWWSVPILTIGGATAVLGVLYATMQDDTKRVLAYSTIENIGFIFVGLGLALAFGANGMAAAAALAMTAALFHAFNHSLFKSLLFFGAGAVQSATGERRLDALGGLIGRMPQTSALVLVGCAAIAALPPLNGFASEWLMLQAILLSPDLPEWALKLSVPAVGALLALAAALAAACFVRLYGVAFLGRPRSPQVAEANEVDRYMLAAMSVLAVLCLAAASSRASSSMGWRGWSTGWSEPTCHCRPKCRGCRSYRLRRAAAPITASSFSSSSPLPQRLPPSPFIASPRMPCGGRLHGTAAFPMQARRRSMAGAASPSRSAGSSQP